MLKNLLPVNLMRSQIQTCLVRVEVEMTRAQAVP